MVRLAAVYYTLYIPIISSNCHPCFINFNFSVVCGDDMMYKALCCGDSEDKCVRFKPSSWYTLVNIQKAMDNRHVSGVNQLFLWPCSVSMRNYQRKYHQCGFNNAINYPRFHHNRWYTPFPNGWFMIVFYLRPIWSWKYRVYLYVHMSTCVYLVYLHGLWLFGNDGVFTSIWREWSIEMSTLW